MTRAVSLWHKLTGQGRVTAPPLQPGLMPASDWAPTHRHRKGGLYRVLGHGTWEADRSPAVIYDDADGTVWIRPTAEFEDGRFEALT